MSLTHSAGGEHAPAGPERHTVTIIEFYPPLAPELPVEPTSMLAFDVYGNVHKGIRAELFAITGSAGTLDPGDKAGRAALAAHVADVAALLDDHSAHEDQHVLPVLEAHAPALHERNATDHAALDARLARLTERAGEITEAAAGERRARLHNLYLDLASFTGAYLAHQEFEERIVMPAVLAAIGVEGAVGVHEAIVGSIPPAAMATSLSLMLPAMNVDDRAEVLGGIQRTAPPEVFSGVWGLARSVLAPADVRAVGARLGTD
jgi:hypothetical protein